MHFIKISKIPKALRIPKWPVARFYYAYGELGAPHYSPLSKM
jgi:hypothetical protein